MSAARGEAPSIGSSRMIKAADGRRYAFADHNCFACGGSNPIGMHLAIELGEGTASTTWLPGAELRGLGGEGAWRGAGHARSTR